MKSYLTCIFMLSVAPVYAGGYNEPVFEAEVVYDCDTGFVGKLFPVLKGSCAKTAGGSGTSSIGPITREKDDKDWLVRDRDEPIAPEPSRPEVPSKPGAEPSKPEPTPTPETPSKPTPSPEAPDPTTPDETEDPGQNPGNDKPVGNAPDDGVTGEEPSEKPKKDRHTHKHRK